MALMNRPTDDPKVSRWWWRALRTWVYSLVDPLWGAFRGENTDEISLANVTGINGVSTAELAILDGITATTAEINKLSGLTADATDLNKTDRTEADGVAEASKVIVLDANMDLLGKRYDINQSHLLGMNSGPGMHFDGVDDYVEIGNLADLRFTDGSSDSPFSIVATIRTNNLGVAQSIFSKYQSGDIREYDLLITPNEVVLQQFSPVSASQGRVAPFSSADIVVIAGTYDGLMANGNKVYINGIQSDNTDSVSGSYAAMPASAAKVGVGRREGGSIPFEGEVFDIKVFNRELSAEEVLALSSGASPGYADKGANQADLVVNGDDWTGATGSTPPNSWSDSGGASVTYIIRDNTGVANMDDKVLEMDVSGSGSKTLYQGVFQAGKRYRVTFAYRNLDGSSGATKVTFGSSANSATLQNTTISGDGVIFTQEVLADGTDLAFEVTTAGTLQVDAVQVVQIGCVLMVRPAGIGHSQWQDTSGNELHGQVNGAIPLNLPVNHLAGYAKKGITADTTLTGVVPAGYRIRSIIIQETAGNAITGGLKIGTTSGGTDVVNAQAVGANALVDCALGTRLFSLTADQTLYVEDVTAWNGASIDLYLEMERIK